MSSALSLSSFQPRLSGVSCNNCCSDFRYKVMIAEIPVCHPQKEGLHPQENKWKRVPIIYGSHCRSSAPLSHTNLAICGRRKMTVIPFASSLAKVVSSLAIRRG